MSHPSLILISDICSYGGIGTSRYIAPYALKTVLSARGHSVQVIDHCTKLENLSDLIVQICEPKTKAIGFSSTFLNPQAHVDSQKSRNEENTSFYSGALWKESTQQWYQFYIELKAELRKKNCHPKFIIGGGKSLFFPEKINGPMDPFDHYFIGRSEQTLTDFLEGRSNEKIIKGPSASACRSTHFCNDDFIARGEALPIEISRGCRFNCKFCDYDKTSQFIKETDELFEEINRNFKLFGTTQYVFVDDCINDSPKKLAILKEVIDRLEFDIEWVAYARMEPLLKDRDQASALYHMGCRGLFIGIETFNLAALRRIGKMYSKEDAMALLADIKKQFPDLIIQASFIVGLPEETPRTSQQLVDYVVENHKIFDLVSFGALGISTYRPDVDKSFMDYSAFSRQPERYGLEVSKGQWSHLGMDSKQASHLAIQANRQLLQHKTPRVIQSIFQYPHLRSLGFSPLEFQKPASQQTLDQAIKKQTKRISTYEQKLFQSLKKN